MKIEKPILEERGVTPRDLSLWFLADCMSLQREKEEGTEFGRLEATTRHFPLKKARHIWTRKRKNYKTANRPRAGVKISSFFFFFLIIAIIFISA